MTDEEAIELVNQISALPPQEAMALAGVHCRDEALVKQISRLKSLGKIETGKSFNAIAAMTAMLTREIDRLKRAAT